MDTNCPKAYQATAPRTLEQQIMDNTVPKNEREWWAAREIERLRAEVDALQAKIDALMLEYCPEEMTPEQVAAYEAAQRPVDEAQIARIDSAMKGEQA